MEVKVMLKVGKDGFHVRENAYLCSRFQITTKNKMIMADRKYKAIKTTLNAKGIEFSSIYRLYPYDRILRVMKRRNDDVPDKKDFELEGDGCIVKMKFVRETDIGDRMVYIYNADVEFEK